MVPTTSSQPRRASVSSPISRLRSERPRPRRMRTQSRQKNAEQDERRRQVRGDEERDEVVVVLLDVPAEQPRQDHAVAEARDREQLAEPLQEPEQDRLRVRDQRERHCRITRLPDVRGPVWNHASTNAPSPSRKAAMPCLTW